MEQVKQTGGESYCDDCPILKTNISTTCPCSLKYEKKEVEKKVNIEDVKSIVVRLGNHLRKQDIPVAGPGNDGVKVREEYHKLVNILF